MNNPYHRKTFERLPQHQRQELTGQLSEQFQRRLTDHDFHSDVESIVGMLREEGHELWNWDRDNEREVWGPGIHQRTMTGLLIEFHPGDVRVSWLENADATEAREVFG